MQTIAPSIKIKQNRFLVLAFFQTLLIFLLVPTARSLEKFVTSCFPSERLSQIIFFGAVVILSMFTLFSLWRRLSRTIGPRKAVIHLLIALFAVIFLALQMVALAEFMHIVLYGFLSYFVLFGLLSSYTQQRALLIAFLYSSTVGTLDEVLQWLHPERVFDVRDILLNVGSAALGLWFTRPFISSQHQAEPRP